MGLDMYLNKMPRYKDVTARQISGIVSYFDWLRAKEEGSEYANCSLKEWCGMSEDELPDKETIKWFKQFDSIRYPSWDTEHDFPISNVIEQVGYWRKANHIHNWFVNNVQYGEDDCDYHNECTKEILEELLDTCKRVYESCTMIVGPVNNGETYENGEWKPIIEQGKVVIDPSVAKELLPTRGGFFFGDTDYDEYYVEQIADTIDIITRALETTDFDKEMIYYVSSW